MAELLSQKKLAEWLNVVPRTIYDLQKKGAPSTLDRGKRVYPWPAFLHWYIEYRINQALEKGGVGAADAEAALEAKLRASVAYADKLEAEAAQAQLALAEKRGQLVTLDYMVGELEKVLTVLRASLLTFSGRVAADLVGCQDTRSVRTVLDPAVDELMRQLSLAGDDDEDEEGDDPIAAALDGAADEDAADDDADEGPDDEPDDDADA